jgi:hypothetical protein
MEFGKAMKALETSIKKTMMVHSSLHSKSSGLSTETTNTDISRTIDTLPGLDKEISSNFRALRKSCGAAFGMMRRKL